MVNICLTIYIRLGAIQINDNDKVKTYTKTAQW